MPLAAATQTARLMAFVLSLLAAVVAKAGDWIGDTRTGCKIWNPNPSPGETVKWTGPCKDGFAEGRGVLEWLREGRPYERDEGVWWAGRQIGEGTQTWPGGNYKGQLADGLPHGRGILVFGASRYEGAFLNGRPNGSGALTSPSGTFQGSWRDGCFSDGERRAAIGVSVQSCP
ncbi:MAG TPA: hypothetical protein VE986_03670 [Hyphomicrobiales bacterium]|nr:hypothetical protein [Hyphomicrobiales bacterium]